MTRMWGARALACAALVVAAVEPARGNPASDALRAKASNQFYNLDHDLALATFREAVAADPQDAGAYRGVASALWVSIIFRRGNMTIDEYLGRMKRPDVAVTPPPPETAAAFREAIDKAIALTRARLAVNPRDADAHYQLGAAVGLRASYTASVEGRVMGAFRAAREAYDEHEKVLALDPRRLDAGLMVGTYRYIVAALSLPIRWAAYVVGFGGDKDKGVRLVEGAAAYPGENQTDARFALLLIYNRERRYDDAFAQLATLRESYPRNRLVWLETAATCLRAGRPADAERFLNDGMARFADDRRPRMFGEDAIWRYKRGAARAALGNYEAAEADLRSALELEGRKWVHARSQLELGKLELKLGNRAAASEALNAAIPLAESDNDPLTAAEARRLLK